jgi:hypothetical protein
MRHRIEQLDVLFILKVFAVSFSAVASYVLIAYAIVYLLMRERIDEAIRELMKRFLFKTPFVVTGYGFAAGLVGYIGIFLTDALLSVNANASASAVNARPKMVLVLFTLFGICFGTLVGLATFFKAKKGLSIGPK